MKIPPKKGISKGVITRKEATKIKGCVPPTTSMINPPKPPKPKPDVTASKDGSK